MFTFGSISATVALVIAPILCGIAAFVVGLAYILNTFFGVAVHLILAYLITDMIKDMMIAGMNLSKK